MPSAKESRRQFCSQRVNTGVPKVMVLFESLALKLHHDFKDTRYLVVDTVGIVVSMSDCHPRVPGFDSRQSQEF